MAEGSSGGGLFDKAKDAVRNLATDENVDKAAEKAKEYTPDSVDGYVDKAADAAKERNE